MTDSLQATDVVVVGAGPAGLALGRELQRRKLSFRLFERGMAPGESWRRMPEHMKLVSPWKATRLPGELARRWPPNHQASRKQFLDYLADYARSNALPISFETDVKTVRRNPDGSFTVETSSGLWNCHRLVNATGYFQNSNVPALDGLQTTQIPWWHSADYGSAERIGERLGSRRKHILIVGKRLSAGQILVELAESGFRVSISHRTPIEFGSGALGWWIFFRIHPWIEAQRLRRHGATARGFEVRMPGGMARRLIEDGTVQTYPAIRRMEAKAVVFENGVRLVPDALVFATGYRPVLAHLHSLRLAISESTGIPRTGGMQSTDVPGLYFLGLDHLRNFQSRFLRGIRNDAEVLALELTGGRQL